MENTIENTIVNIIPSVYFGFLIGSSYFIFEKFYNKGFIGTIVGFLFAVSTEKLLYYMTQ